MATVPSGTRFIGIADTVNLKERKSAVLNSETQPYTIQDIADTVGVGAQGPQGVEGPAGPPGPVGPAGLTWQGSWISGTSYSENDAVGYDGASWFCILPTSGTTPPDVDTTHWALLASQGAQGPQGVQGPQGPQGPSGGAGTLQQTVNNGNTINNGVTTMTVLADSIKTNDFLGGKIELVSTVGANPFLRIGLPASAGKTVKLTSADSQTASRTIKLPDADGTIALTSDITSSQVTKVLKTTITSAQVLQLFTTPITILNSNNPLTVAYPINIYVKRNAGDAYTLATNSFSIINDFNTSLTANLNPNPLANTSVGYFQSAISLSQNLSGGDKNVLYKLKANVGNPTGGTGDLEVYVTYVEITL